MSLEMSRNAPVTSQDLNALKAAAWEWAQQQDWDAILARSYGWVCAHIADRLIGFVYIVWDGDAHAFLLDTTVHRGYQRRGIGTALVEEAIDLARTSGAEWLHVDYEEELESFYLGCGFRPTRAGLLRLSSGAPMNASLLRAEGP